MMKISNDLNIIIDRTTRVISAREPSTKFRFRRSPIETKKILLKISLRGRISEVTWCVKSESDRITPAIKAPIAKESPRA